MRHLERGVSYFSCLLAEDGPKEPLFRGQLGLTLKDITVGDILVVLEGPVSLSDCVMDEDICENSGKCVTKIVWEKMKKGIEDVINSITLQDMIDDHNKNILDNDITNLIIK